MNQRILFGFGTDEKLGGHMQDPRRNAKSKSRNPPRSGAIIRKRSTTRSRLTKEDRRALILDAALKVFSERGYSATAMEHVAELAGVTRSVLYDHFTSKKDLYITLLRIMRDEVMDHVGSRTAEARDAEAVLRTALESFFSFVREHPVTWRMLFHDYVGDPDVMAAHTETHAEASVIMVGALIEESQFFPGMQELDLNQRQILAHIWGAGLKAVARWWRDNPRVPQSKITDAAMLALWPGFERLSRKPGKTGPS